MTTHYVIDLKAEERERLQQLIRKGKTSARSITRARILLLAEAGQSNQAIVIALQTSLSTVKRVRRRFVEEGIEEALYDRPRPGVARKLDGRQEALLVALACSEPPAERVCWTMQLLADRLVELGEVETISDETVRRVLKKTN
jgi:transposase